MLFAKHARRHTNKLDAHKLFAEHENKEPAIRQCLDYGNENLNTHAQTSDPCDYRSLGTDHKKYYARMLGK